MQVGPLQATSSYSLLDSTIDLAEYVALGKELGYQALSLTDTNVMYGSLAFYQLCQKHQIKPLLGLKLEMTDPKTNHLPNDILIYAKNQAGYQALLQISTLKMSKDEAQDTTVRFKELKPYLHDVVVVIPPENNFVSEALAVREFAYAKTWLQTFHEQLGDDLYLGINTHLDPTLKQSLLLLAEEFGISPVDCHAIKSLTPQDSFALEVLQAIKRNQPLTPEQKMNSRPDDKCLTSPTVLPYQSQTLKLVDKLNVTIPTEQLLLPKYPLPIEETSSCTYLAKLCEQGLSKRFVLEQIPNDLQLLYQERLANELKVIEEMGFCDYFLIVWDVTNYAHQQQILIGPGRGSAAGSLVSYVLQITDVDPIKYQLVFERFLNVERHQMPDIDLDIPDDKRELILQYVHQKYGHQKMAQIITFGTFGKKQAINDVVRMLGGTKVDQQNWRQALSDTTAPTLLDSYKQSQKLRNLIADSPNNQRIFEVALRLEGHPRNSSTHAAGVLLSDTPLVEHIPLQAGNEGILQSQYAKAEVETVGLLKMDFLGLRNLSILDEIVKLVEADFGHQINLAQIDLNDPDVLKMFQKGETQGIFQFESSGIRNALRQVSPQSFEEIVAVNALYRPGPMENIPLYAARKKHQAPVDYLIPQLEPILGNTYGVMIYQEQVMQVAHVMGGFTLGQADILRRAMSKKDVALIEELQQKFIAGALEQGYTKEQALAVYEHINKFAGYGFNRSHAVAYSKMAVQLAYLKVHYPGQFFVTLLNSLQSNSNQMKNLIFDARSHGLAVKAPDINQSGIDALCQGETLYLGFSSIKTFRKDLGRLIGEERQANGAFTSFANFIQRLPEKYLKEEHLTPLIYAGTFDELNPNRKALLNELPKLIANQEFTQMSQSLADYLEPTNTETIGQNGGQVDLRAKEFEFLGMYFADHPVSPYQKLNQSYQALPLNVVNELPVNQTFRSFIYVKWIKVIRTKTKGEEMAFLTVEDETGETSVTVFPSLYRRLKNQLQERTVYLLTGKLTQYQGKYSISAANLVPAQNFSTQLLTLTFARNLPVSIKQQVRQILSQHPGDMPVVITDLAHDQDYYLESKFWIPNDLNIVRTLTNLLGPVNVKLT